MYAAVDDLPKGRRFHNRRDLYFEVKLQRERMCVCVPVYVYTKPGVLRVLLPLLKAPWSIPPDS